jgi:hypothetical protein
MVLILINMGLLAQLIFIMDSALFPQKEVRLLAHLAALIHRKIYRTSMISKIVCHRLCQDNRLRLMIKDTLKTGSGNLAGAWAESNSR